MQVIAFVCLFAIASFPAGAQESTDRFSELADRPVAAIQLQGLKRVGQQEVLNNIRSAVGQPLNPETVKDDVARLNRLGHFKYVDAAAQLQTDGSIVLTFVFQEQAIIHEIQVVGNKLITDRDVLAAVSLAPGGPRDDFLIQNAKRKIEDLYRKRGHFLVNVTIDETELEQSGLLIFRVIEGPRVRVRAVEFQGNAAIDSRLLLAQVRTRTAVFIVRKGELDEEVLADDIATLDRFYKDLGFLDVRVDRRIDLSPDSSEAMVTFLIDEGSRYTLRNVQATDAAGRPLKVFAPQQILAIFVMKAGDFYTVELARKSLKALQDSYGLMGYVDIAVRPTILRVPNQARVDVLLEIDEGRQFNVGEVIVQGNFLTRDKVIRRELWAVTPGRPFDSTQIESAQNRLLATRLFNDVRITVQRPEPADSYYRDVLVEVKERNTGSVNFGVALGSDSGVFGELSLTQNNFDITDWPASLEELLTGRAFRGGGQRFNMVIRPGTEIFQYLVSITEPHIFDTDYSLTVLGQFRQRFFDQYDESRVGGNVRLARQFGDIWTVALQTRLERIELDDIDPSAPTEIFEDAGPDDLSTLGIAFTRTTIDRLNRPRDGSRFEFAYDRYGALGGDFDFNLVSADFTAFFTLYEDILDRATTLRLNSRVGYIWDGRAPTYERFYLGGKSLRGFDFRAIAPKGIRNDNGQPSNDTVGGDWMFSAGPQVEVPVLGESMSAVAFIDSGTVIDDVGFDDYRVTIGAGIRLYIPQFGDVPIALDFAYPLIDVEGDDTQVFIFSAEFPF